MSKMAPLVLFLLIFCEQFGIGCTLSASFYGDSYIHVPLEDASSETDIKLHFRTYRTEGLLFMAAGSTDYCVIELRAGMVRVRMDLGSGEATLGSPPGVVFSDMQWHFVHLVRSDDQIQLNVDNIYQTVSTTPGEFYELNVHNGIYLGTLETFSDHVFFGHWKEFRGCLQDLLFNSVGVLPAARVLNDPLNVFGITWDCSPEFGASSDQPISFLENTSFMAFPPMATRNEGRITFDLRTRSRNALVLYNSGRLQSSDFIAIEIIGGRMKLTINRGSGTIELLSKKDIDDGDWHQVETVVDQTSVRISVDGRRKERHTSFGDNRLLDLYAHLYVGGVAVADRARAIHKMLESLSNANAAAGSLIGCIQNFKVNGQLLGFREAKITKGLHPECLWSYPCFSNPCIENSNCVEEGFYYYKCVCEKANCFKSGATGNSSSVAMTDILHVQDLIVREGGRSLISRTNINLLLNYTEYNIRESSIVFKVMNSPQHGTVTVDVGRRPADQTTFTLLDLHGNKVRYEHDDSESTADSISLELEFLSADESLPDAFTKKYNFTLVVQILVWNDKPLITLPDDNTLVLVANTQVQIVPKIMNVIDKDDRPRDLEYTVQYQQGYDIGYFEIQETLGIRARITAFTQADINEGHIKYTHRGEMRQEVRLQVSDGKDMSDPVNLIVEAIPLRLDLVTNTGLQIPSGVTSLLLRDNLTFSINTPIQKIDIRYEITDPPYFGSIQRQQYADNQWITVTSFLQEDIDNSRIRYEHNAGYHPQGDYFLFRVKAMDVTTDEYDFIIRIMKTEAVLESNATLQMDGVKERTISKHNLNAYSTVRTHTPRDIHYLIETAPTKGNILRLDQSAGKIHKHRIARKSNFTQQEIDSDSIIYRLHKALFVPIQDEFRFRLVIPGNSSKLFTFQINYEPIDTDLRFVNNGLMNVIEGDKKVITPDDLFMDTENIDNFRFTVTSGPNHGMLVLYDSITSLPIASNITAFTTDQIVHNQLYYDHDDSEHWEDSFNFIATPVVHQSGFMVQEISQFTGTFDIKMILRNDNAPERVVDRVFKVVVNSGRVITTDDIKYVDPDVDFDSSRLLYSHDNISNGAIVSTDNHAQSVSKFTQKDLEDGRLYFKHHGAAYGRFVVLVTDGEHISTGLWEVQASEPNIWTVVNTGLAVQRGKEVVLSSGNLTVDTNIDTIDKDIKIVINQPPTHGVLKKMGEEKSRFNMADVKKGHITYQHNNGESLTDSFSFVVKIKDTQISEQMHINIVLDTHQHPPRIIHNKVKMLDEKTKVVISQQDLEVAHPETAPKDIQYTITSLPEHGYLSVKGLREGEDVQKFTQDDINKNKVKYTHQEKGTQTDTFGFDVSNGIASLQGLEFVFNIVPLLIPLVSKKVTVVEGERKLLSNSIIYIPNEHFRKESLQYVIVRQPRNGQIIDVDKSDTVILQFSQSQVDNDRIYYVHSDNETVSDKFTLMVKSSSSDKHSNPHTVSVDVIPINDQPPRVVVNKRLEVWTGSVTLITKGHLSTEDLDTPASGLMYIISTPSNGYVALTENPGQNVVNFTQQMINNGRVVFVHSGSQGADKGRLEFRVTDGENYERSATFHIHAKALNLTTRVNSTLLAFPQIIQPLTNSHLLTVSNNINQTRPIVYTLQQRPRKGLLVKNVNGTFLEVTSFSQDDINKGLMAYQHEASMDTWTQLDDFVFEVSTRFAKKIKFNTFQIIISFGNINEDNKEQLVHLSPVYVNEGGVVKINKSHLNIARLRKRTMSQSGDSSLPEITYVINSPPSHGLLQVLDENATEGTRFSQQDVNRGDVTYYHDHSDSLKDQFLFHLEVEPTGSLSLEGQHPPPPQTLSFNLTIKPINDQTYEMVKDFLSIDLVQGFTANITRDQLRAVDPDTPPSGILYHIRNPPTIGILVNRDEPDRAVKTFTQEDIDDNKIVFIHDGGRESGAFWFFIVSDDRRPKDNPVHIVFNINVILLSLSLRSIQDLRIVQGYSSVVLSPENIEVETNGNKLRILYNVTRQPTFGNLYLNDNPVSQFSQKNIELGEIIYVQTDFRSPADSFEFIVYDMQNFVADQKMNIKVLAQLKQSQGPIQVLPGKVVTLTVNTLDASDLKRTTQSEPVYILTSYPKLGRLVKKMRNSDSTHRQKRDIQAMNMNYHVGDVPVSNFSHQDIIDEVIQFKPIATNHTSPVSDSFAFVLTADNAQPAPGQLELMVHPVERPALSTKSPSSGTNGGESPSGETKPKSTASTDPGGQNVKPGNKEDVGNDHLKVVFIVCGLTVLVIIIFIIIKCVKHRRRKKKEYQMAVAQMKEDSKAALAQPSVFVDTQRDIHSDGDKHSADTDSRSEDSSNIPTVNFGEREREIAEIQYRSPTALYKPSEMARDTCVTPSPSTSGPAKARPKSADVTRTPPKSPDMSRAEFSRTVPMCKVTPLVDAEDDTDVKTPYGSLKHSSAADQVTFDWEHVDPELLQHCRKTNPVLHQNKYWV